MWRHQLAVGSRAGLYSGQMQVRENLDALAASRSRSGCPPLLCWVLAGAGSGRALEVLSSDGSRGLGTRALPSKHERLDLGVSTMDSEDGREQSMGEAEARLLAVLTCTVCLAANGGWRVVGVQREEGLPDEVGTPGCRNFQLVRPISHQWATS